MPPPPALHIMVCVALPGREWPVVKHFLDDKKVDPILGEHHGKGDTIGGGRTFYFDEKGTEKIDVDKRR